MTEPQNTEPAADDTEQTFRDAFTPPWADEDAPDAEAYESAIRAFNGELRASGRHAPAGGRGCRPLLRRRDPIPEGEPTLAEVCSSTPPRPLSWSDCPMSSTTRPTRQADWHNQFRTP